MSDRARDLLQQLNRLRRGLEAIRHITLYLPIELTTVDGVLQVLDDAKAAGLLDEVTPDAVAHESTFYADPNAPLPPVAAALESQRDLVETPEMALARAQLAEAHQ